MSNLIHEAISLFGDTALSLLALGAAWLTTKIASLVKNQKVSNIILRVDDALLKATRSVFAKFVEPRRTAGEWNDETKAKAVAMAVAEAKSYIGTKGLKELIGVIGNLDLVDAYLSSSVESAVIVSKNQAALVGRLDSEKKP